MTYGLTFDLINCNWMTGHFDWKNGSGGEHHYATIFQKTHMKTDMLNFDFL